MNNCLILLYFIVTALLKPYPKNIPSVRFITDNQREVLKGVKKSIISVKQKNYTLKIETTYVLDSVIPEERHLFIPPVLSQKLIFLKDGKIVCVRQNPGKKIYQKVRSGHSIMMLSNVYTDAYVLVGKYKTAFAVNGYGGCNTCEETLDFYTLTGAIAYKNNTYREWELFLKTYGIKNYNKSDNEVSIYPPDIK
jgi:hypothetical protein